ncbi:MAG: DUF1800 domain-containing protein [Comamonadaceae bacterium]|nr:DUF1800 domain-containing protein [Comamonadaceae bacterium]
MVKLNLDGTPRLDASGKPLPSYDLAEIKGFSRVFTGWTYPTVAGAAARTNNPRNYLGNMLAVTANHEFGTKVLLDGVVAPANLTMEDDLAFAHRNIFNHPNVGPFIGKLLIQKLVTSDPSPGYVSRVATVFNNNGAGMRGDLRAVVRAILLDPEARGAVKIDPAYGKLTEPVVYMTAVTRALGGRTDGVYLRGASNTLGQFVFYPPSVFNYYPPDYVIPGTSLLGPEFAIQNTSTAFARANFASALVLVPQIAPDLDRLRLDGHGSRSFRLSGGRRRRRRPRRPPQLVPARRPHDAGDALGHRDGRERGRGNGPARPGAHRRVARRHLAAIPSGALTP